MKQNELVEDREQSSTFRIFDVEPTYSAPDTVLVVSPAFRTRSDPYPYSRRARYVHANHYVHNEYNVSSLILFFRFCDTRGSTGP